MGSSASKAVRKYPKTSQIPTSTGTKLKDGTYSNQARKPITSEEPSGIDESINDDVSQQREFSTDFLQRLQELGQADVPDHRHQDEHQHQQQFLFRPKPGINNNAQGTGETGMTTHHALMARQHLNRQLKLATVDFVAQDESTPRKQLNAATLSEILYLRDKGMSSSDLNKRFNLDPDIITKLSQIKLPVNNPNDGDNKFKKGTRRPMTVTEAFAEQEAEFVKKIEKENHDKPTDHKS